MFEFNLHSSKLDQTGLSRVPSGTLPGLGRSRRLDRSITWTRHPFPKKFQDSGNPHPLIPRQVSASFLPTADPSHHCILPQSIIHSIPTDDASFRATKAKSNSRPRTFQPTGYQSWQPPQSQSRIYVGVITAGYALSGGAYDPSKPTDMCAHQLYMHDVSHYKTQLADEALTGATSCPIEHFTYWDTAIMAL